MPRLPAALLLAGLCLDSAAGDAFVPMAGAAVGQEGEAMRGRFQNVVEVPARTTALLAGETAAIVPGDYLAETNAWRAEVGAPPLVWDDTIAKVAQSWADNLESQGCDMVHSTSEWQKAAECTAHDGGTVGHYTQLVWAESKKMGCGMATCGNKGTVWVCNFYPSGNWMGEAPFCKANVPSTMPTCSSIGPGVGAGDTPCLPPSATKCGYEEKCCSCEPKGGSGEKEMEEGIQDEAQGARDREEGMRNNDPSEVQEGSDEKRAGRLEVEKGKAKEEEYLMTHEFHKVVEITGLGKTDFDEVKFQAAMAEVLGVPLFDIKVQQHISNTLATH